MASISDIRTGLATRLATISGLRVSSFQPDLPNPPFANIIPNTIQYDDAFQRGMQTYGFTVTIIVGRADERTAQNKLDAFASSTGTNSVKLAIEGDKTLGGVVFDTRVTEMRSYGQLAYGEVIYLAAEFSVICYAN